MTTYPTLQRRQRLALAASACVTGLAIVTAVAMLFDERADRLWAGLDAHHARQAAACTAQGGADGDACVERLVLAAPTEEALR